MDLIQNNQYQGTVKFFNEDGNYGFIVIPEADNEIFYHRSAVKGEIPSKGDQVNFSLGKNEKGYLALDVDIIE